MQKIFQLLTAVGKEHMTVIYVIAVLLGSSIYAILLQKKYVSDIVDAEHEKNKKLLFRNIAYFFVILLGIGFICEVGFHTISFYLFDPNLFSLDRFFTLVYKVMQSILSIKPRAITGTGFVSPYIIGLEVVHIPFIALFLYALMRSFARTSKKENSEKTEENHISPFYDRTFVGLLFSIVFLLIIVPLVRFIIQIIIAIPTAFSLNFNVFREKLAHYFWDIVKHSTPFYTFFIESPYNTIFLDSFIIGSKWIFTIILFPLLFYFFVFKRGRALAYALNLRVLPAVISNDMVTSENHPNNTIANKNVSIQNKKQNTKVVPVQKRSQGVPSVSSTTPVSMSTIDFITLLIQRRYKQKEDITQLIARVFNQIEQVQEVVLNKYDIPGAQLFVKFREGLPISHLQTRGILIVQIIPFNFTQQDIKTISLMKETMRRTKATMGLVLVTAPLTKKMHSSIKQEITTLRKKTGKQIVLVAGRNVAQFVLKFGRDSILHN